MHVVTAGERSAARIRAAFREIALALMDWRQPPLMSRREYEHAEGITRPYDWATDESAS